MTWKQSLARWGEHLAAEYLQEKGYTVLERNARTAYGEIDLIARQQNVTVFIEVKTRSNSAFGPPEAAITPRKREHMLASAQDYLLAHPQLDGDWRVDVIAIQRDDQRSSPVITHFENALIA